MHHDRLDAERTPDGLTATCSCGEWRCAGPSAESLGDQWDAHRRASGATAPPLTA